MRAIVLALLAVAATTASAQSRPTGPDAYPQRPIRMIVDFSAGGLSDTMVRAVAPRMSETLGQPIVMDNRPGASGALAYGIVAKAVPDGHTLVTLSTGFSLNLSLVSKLPFDTNRDFVAIGLIGTTPNVLVTNPKTAKTTAELVAFVKGKPGATNAASTGIGSTPHLTLELFKRAAGIDPTHVPFNGSGPALADMIGGRMDFMFVNLPASIGHIKGGRIVALAVGSEQRTALLPDVPTMQESGFKGFRSVSWAGIGGPAGLPKPILARLSRDLIAAVDSPDVRDRISAAGGEARSTTPEQFRVFIDDEIKRWARVIKDAGVRVDG
ncbi:MAG: tripartite tricarboxylate transporter substrate binding protein [Proteobacteria bacterium]|nr:tripartite tricarboxylate transporter substrate binding protein [Burkholderiales bacterium]